MDSFSRREVLALAVTPVVLQAACASPPSPPAAGAAPGPLFVCMHQASSERFDFRTAMEGYAKAGIRAVEPNLLKVREFTEKESVAAAKRLLDDLGLRPVSTSNQLFLMEPGEERTQSLEDLKWKVELARAIGADRLVTPSAGPGTYTADDYKRGVDHMREAAEIARPFGITLMLEHARSSRFVASLPTAARPRRDGAVPRVRGAPVQT